MEGAQKLYTNDLHDKFGYFATWEPGARISLGDIGVLDGNLFRPVASLDYFGLTFESNPPGPISNFSFTSSTGVSITTKFEGSVAPAGSALTQADAGFIVDFSKEHSTVFKTFGAQSTMIKDPIALKDPVIKLFKEGKWDKHYVIVTELIVTQATTILISSDSNSKIEIKANAKIGSKDLDIANPACEFSDAVVKSMDIKFEAEKGLTPLFKVMGLKRPFPFGELNFKGTALNVKAGLSAAGVDTFHLLTPETAKTQFKSQMNFGLISDDLLD